MAGNTIMKGKNPLWISALIYTFVALLTVLSAWYSGLYRYDLSLTISIYVALRPWTAIVYFLCVAAMVALIFFHVRQSGMPKYRKVFYSVIFLCVSGCAMFPCNGGWSPFVADMHNVFAYALMLAVTASLVLLIFKGRTKAQKLFGISASLYAFIFIVAYAIVRWDVYRNTVFIWENLFIYILLVELWLEGESNGSEGSQIFDR